VVYILIFIIFIVISSLLAVPVVIFTLECIIGSWPSRQVPTRDILIRPPVAILIPAHNESAGIAGTLANIQAEAKPGDRIVVVADNCNDQTAEIARRLGAEVVERHDALRRGKGFALDAGIQYLKHTPPPIVVFIDADCRIAEGTLDTLAAAVLVTKRPVQARNLQIAPPEAGLSLAAAEFAFLVKNHVRPLGLSRLGLPCLMTGTGMALPWCLLEQADLSTGHQVEDMKFALDLARGGHAPRFCEGALVTSFFPHSKAGTETQRARWESGHLSMMRYALNSLSRPSAFENVGYVALLFDILVPPLTLLAAALFLMMAMTGVFALLGGGLTPLAIATTSALSFLFAAGVAWVAFGMTVLPPQSLSQVPRYAVGKIRCYPKTLLAGKAAEWIRTDRTGPQ
jgi:cellulose synthase/poly-beta-1,6-N-acetylglucosamine synthase-like glycosyltransferase